MQQENPIEQLVETIEKAKRPTAITVICILGFVGAAFTIPLIFSGIAKSIGGWYPPYLAVSSALGFVFMVGMWQMKKWSVIGYTAFMCINQVVLLYMGIWTIMALIVPGIVVGIALAHFNKME